ncbi:MAG: HAMP domain-containing sensor histidine kinase [Agathobacter sp.]|nr:HAMP domain-containing sensor histidine kinase [Agathobacter sp.]
MLKTLRNKFIKIAMLSVAAVLVVIIISINFANYIQITKTSNTKISLIAQNDGIFPNLSNDKDSPDKNIPNKKRPQTKDELMERERKLPLESSFDTRYFTVLMRNDGTVISVDTGKISAVSTSTAKSYAIMLYKDEKSKGYLQQYKYKSFVKEGETSSNILYVFLDCERELDSFWNTIFASIFISVISYIIIFYMVCHFSKKILKPVAESYEKQKRFITDASHEIKTPLTIIDANTEIIEMTMGENDWTISTKKQIKRLTDLTEKLVFLSRMDEENTRLEMEEFSLSEALLDTIHPFSSVAKAKGKTLTYDIISDINYYGDEKNIRQLISILLDNALKYSNENGEISIKLYTLGKNKIITVWNSVENISSGKHDELFDRFYLLDESRNSQTGGFGIGLSVAYAIVKAHKGTIKAKSDDEKSILFTITL